MNIGFRTICVVAMFGTLLCPEISLAKSDKALPVIESTSMFYDGNFLLATAAVKNKPAADVRAIIVPHHLLAATYTARMFRMAAGRRVDTVFIVGPNHFNIGPTTVATAKALWRTPQGQVAVDGALVDRLADAFRIRESAPVFTGEHSIGAIIPYVARYFPKTDIVPITLSSYAGIGEAKQLAEWLSKNAGRSSLIVFSIDFSHYLSEELADREDALTRRLMVNGDIGAISRLTNDNVDSPASLMTALEFARLRGMRTDIVASGNSNRVRPEKTPSTTSYFAVAFRQK